MKKPWNYLPTNAVKQQDYEPFFLGNPISFRLWGVDLPKKLEITKPQTGFPIAGVNQNIVKTSTGMVSKPIAA